MDEYHKPKLVIGGANSGRRVMIKCGQTLRLPVPMRLPDYCHVDLGPASSIHTTEDYKAFNHVIGSQRFSIWVPSVWDDRIAAQKVYGVIADLWGEYINGNLFQR